MLALPMSAFKIVGRVANLAGSFRLKTFKQRLATLY
jgi:hypothetical protein